MNRVRGSIWNNFALASLLALTPLAGHAQVWIKPGDETLTLNLGGITSRIESSVRLDGNRGGNGVNLEGDAGLDKNRTTFSLSGAFRIAQKHRIDAFYNEYKRTATRTTQKEYVIDDVVIPAGTSLTSEATSKLGFIGYRYSFAKSPDMEFAGGLGTYGGNFKFKFNATNVNIDESTTLPLPVLYLTGDFYLTDRTILRANVGGLKVTVNNVDGSVLTAGLAGEYLFTNNFGVGLGLDYFDLEVDATKNGFKGNAQLKTSKATLYLTGRF